MGYFIFLDTNIIYQDFYLRTNEMKKLLKFTSHKPVDLCLTEFNYQEVLKKYRDKARPAIKKVKEAKKVLKELEIEDLVDFSKTKADIYVNKYQEHLDNVIATNDIKIIGYPTGEYLIERISEKYFNEVKPFDENKISFQDAIIWESIIEYYNNKDPENVVFISNNSKDFANNDKNQIHEDLEGDIPGILYYDSLKAFLEYEEDSLKDYFDDNYDYDEEELKKQIKDYFDNKNPIFGTVESFLMDSSFEGEFFEGWGTDAYIDNMDVDIEDVSLDIEDNVLLISFYLDLDVSFSIETLNPVYERGDPGDGMMSEESSTNILITGNITYSLDKDDVVEYVEQEIQLN